MKFIQIPLLIESEEQQKEVFEFFKKFSGYIDFQGLIYLKLKEVEKK